LLGLVGFGIHTQCDHRGVIVKHGEILTNLALCNLSIGISWESVHHPLTRGGWWWLRANLARLWL
jgi:hypothetical protein